MVALSTSSFDSLLCFLLDKLGNTASINLGYIQFKSEQLTGRIAKAAISVETRYTPSICFSVKILSFDATSSENILFFNREAVSSKFNFTALS